MGAKKREVSRKTSARKKKHTAAARPRKAARRKNRKSAKTTPLPPPLPVKKATTQKTTGERRFFLFSKHQNDAGKTKTKAAKQARKKPSNKKSVRQTPPAQKKERRIFGFFRRKKTKSQTNEPEFLKSIDRDVHTKNVDEEFRLWLSNGMAVRSIAELQKAVSAMQPEAYANHVTKEKNELADWVKEIAKQPKLAKALEKAETKKEAENVLSSFTHIASTTPEKQEKPEPAKPVVQHEQPPLEEVVEPAEEEPEEQLSEEERRLQEEEETIGKREEALNAERIELARRRYELLKKRGALEKKQFDAFVKQTTTPAKLKVKAATVEKAPDRKQLMHNRAQLLKLIETAQRLVQDRKLEDAQRTLSEIRSAYNTGIFSPDERKQLHYSIMEIETDIKIASL